VSAHVVSISSWLSISTCANRYFNKLTRLISPKVSPITKAALSVLHGGFLDRRLWVPIGSPTGATNGCVQTRHTRENRSASKRILNPHLIFLHSSKGLLSLPTVLLLRHPTLQHHIRFSGQLHKACSSL